MRQIHRNERAHALFALCPAVFIGIIVGGGGLCHGSVRGIVELTGLLLVLLATGICHVAFLDVDGASFVFQHRPDYLYFPTSCAPKVPKTLTVVLKYVLSYC